MAKKKKKKRTPKKQPKKAPGSASKTANARRRSRVLAILIAVAFWGLVWGLWSLRKKGIFENRQNRHRAYATRLFLQEIEIALSHYRDRRGVVPPCLDEKRGGAVLFEKLLAGPERFLGPRPDRIRHGETEDEPSAIIDAWGHPIRYRTGAPPPGSAKVTSNPHYDLWSTGGDPGNPRKKWITAQ